MARHAVLLAFAALLPWQAAGHGPARQGESHQQTHKRWAHEGGMGKVHGEANQRFGGHEGSYKHIEGRYGGSGAPINNNHDLRYIQNHMAKALGLSGAPDNATQIPAPMGTNHFFSDPGGGVVAAAPKATMAPWEVGVTRPLVDIDLALNPDDPYANRVAGIQDSFAGNYASALPQLRTAIEGGQNDPTTLAFAALSAYRRGEMQDAAAWARESLEKESGGPWSKLADSVEHLTKDNIGKLSLPKPKPTNAHAGEGPAPGAVGPKLFPKGIIVSEPLKGVGGMLADARAAFAVADFPQVDKLASTVLFSDGANVEALRLRAGAAVRSGRYTQALDDAVRGLALKPESRDFLEAGAVAAGRTGDYQTARTAALAMLAQDPKSAAGLRLLTFAEAGLRDRAAMTAALERAAAVDASNASLLARARALPSDGDLLGLFTDAFLLGDKSGAPLPEKEGRNLAKTLVAVGGGALAGLALAALALALNRRRRRASEKPALDLSIFQPGAMRASGDPIQVGPYRILEKLGAGGMGVVYKAQDTKLGRTVALKRLRPEIAAEPREHERFLKEARIVSGLTHPGIVQIYSVQDAPEGDYLVFEFVEGRTLAETVSARGRLPLAEARSLIAQAADAVEYAHSQGVVHRDLKPSNLMLDARGRVRVMDFGVARAEKEALSRLTGAETSSGSPPYIAPEQAEGVTTPACDVFALGACLYELLSGKPPFEGTAGAMHMAKRSGTFKPLGSPVDAVIARALDPDPAKRFASARELAHAL